MTGSTDISKDLRTLTVRVPFAIKKRGGRKLVVAPDGAPWCPPCARIDNTMVKAIARGFRWQKILEDGSHATIFDLARAEKINPSYVSRVLRMTLIAPEIVEAILAGRQPEELTMARAMRPFPMEWARQQEHFCAAGAVAFT